MSIAVKLCLTAAFVFFMTGLLTGIWKYALMARSPKASAPRYVNVAHQSSLMYSFAAALLGWFASYSVFPEWINTLSAASALIFFGFAISSYVLHGVLQDTSNQFRKPHALGSWSLPPALMVFFMVVLIIAEVGGTAVLGVGALLAIW